MAIRHQLVGIALSEDGTSISSYKPVPAETPMNLLEEMQAAYSCRLNSKVPILAVGTEDNVTFVPMDGTSYRGVLVVHSDDVDEHALSRLKSVFSKNVSQPESK